MAVHPESGKIEMAKGTARGTLKVGNHPISVANIRRTTVQINEAQLALYKLVLGLELKPMWERL